MPSLAAVLGSECELVLHDFSDVHHTIVAIEENIAGRTIGCPLTDPFFNIIRLDESSDNRFKYPSFTVVGKELLSSTIFQRNEADQLIGCSCINRDINHWKLVRDIVNELCGVLPLGESQDVVEKEIFIKDVEELLMDTIKDVISTEHKPIDYLSKEEKRIS